MLPWSLHWFLNLFITLGGRVAGRDTIYGSFHIRLTVDVAELNEIIFFGSLSTINRHVFFCLDKKIFFTSIRFVEFFKKWYFWHSKRTFKLVYLENNWSHGNFSKLRKLGLWLFFTEIVAQKLFKYFLTYKSKEINAKSFFPNLAPFDFFFWPNKKIRVYLLLIKNRKKLSRSNLRHRLSI